MAEEGRDEKGKFVKGHPHLNKKGYKSSASSLAKTGEKNPRYGIKESVLTKRKKSKSLKENYKKHPELKEKARIRFTGKNNPNWKNGITKLTETIRKHFKYRQWRSDIFTRDNFTCQECSIKGGYLEAHHLKKFSVILEENKIKKLEQALNCEELWNINNGITLCLKCHNKTKGRKDKK